MTQSITDTSDATGRFDAARDTASRAYHAGLDKVVDTRDAAADVAKRTVQNLDANPIAVLLGGLAIGAVAGSLLPRSVREKTLLAPVGKRLGETAKAAVKAAKTAGEDELQTLGLTKSVARGQAKHVIEGVVKALATAGAAAAKTATKKGDA